MNNVFVFLLATFLLFHCCYAFLTTPSFSTILSSRVTTVLFSAISPPPSGGDDTTTQRVVSTHKRWGIDKDHLDEYWFNSKIHTLGNTGFMGAVHAAMAPFATRIIDDAAYDGINIREFIAEELAKSIQHNKARVVDLCCGVGMSTRALQGAFPDAETVIGVDTSPEMISMANFLSGYQCRMQPTADFFSDIFKEHFAGLNKPFNTRAIKKVYVKARRAIAEYTCVNAENTALPDKSFDLVTIMYAFHEAPSIGREKILAEAHRLLHKGGLLALLDISPDYQASKTMLAGEPYVLEYQKNINRQLQMVKGFTKAKFKTIVPGHVGLWLLHRV